MRYGGHFVELVLLFSGRSKHGHGWSQWFMSDYDLFGWVNWWIYVPRLLELVCVVPWIPAHHHVVWKIRIVMITEHRLLMLVRRLIRDIRIPRVVVRSWYELLLPRKRTLIFHESR